MPLRSAILSGNPRLEQAAAGGPSVKPAPPADDSDAVRRIQRALVALGHPLPVSFANGPDKPDGKFGEETRKAVVAFQRKAFPTQPEEWDGRVGKNTLAKMDARLPAPAPPTPTPPGPQPTLLRRDDAVKAIRAYLSREMRRDVVSVLVGHPQNLIVLGETHVGDALKAFVLSEMAFAARRRPLMTHFHASERFPNTLAIRQQISDFIKGPLGRPGLLFGLDPRLQRFAPVLTQAALFPGHRYGILPIDQASFAGEDRRHKALFDGFVQSAALCPDVPFGSIGPSASRGNILLGARHAARTHVAGHAAETTCQLLIKAGWKVHVVRMTVSADLGLFPREDLNLILRAGAADHTPIDVLGIADSLAGNKPFYADLTKEDSPFRQLRDGDSDATDIAYNRLFDALLHVPSSLSLGPSLP
jgi:hypothetical protein